MSTLSYQGHPGRLRQIWLDNLKRYQSATTVSEQVERIRAHCDFMRTAAEVHQELANQIRARHGWTRAG